MLNDLTHAIRMLLHAKGWTAIVVLSLGLGIGANTALFSAINGLVLRKIPVADPDTLVRLRWAGKNDMATSTSDYGFTAKTAAGENVRTTFSYPMYQQFRTDNQTMADLVACAPFGRVNVVVDGQADIASAFISSGNYYRVLGITALRGRTLLPEDDRSSSPPTAVISAKYWRTRFGGDASAVGKTIQVNGVPVTIAGVIAPAFTGVQQPVGDAPDVALPLALEPLLTIGPTVRSANDSRPPIPRLEEPTYWWLQVIGRLKPGVTAAQVQANLGNVFQNTARAGLAQYLASLVDAERALSRNRNRTEMPHLIVDSAARGVYDVNATDLRAVSILSAVVALVLLIVCANVANLLLSRAAARQKEISVRLSLGATRARLVRQLLTESLLLAAAGGALGILVGNWGQGLLPGALSDPRPLDWRVLSFVIGVTGATGIVFGIAPAWRGTSIDVNSALKETGRSVVGSRSILGKALLVVQVAISLVLLVGAGLFLRTLQNLRGVDVGFNPRSVALFRINPTLNRYDLKRGATLYRGLLERIVGVAGVRSAALSQPALLAGSVNQTSIFVQGRTYPPRSLDSINRVQVSPSFFATMEIPLARGRGFTDRDDDVAPKVVVINEAAVRKYFANQDPIGQHFGSSPETSGQLEIVGVLRDAKYNSVRDEAPPTMYVPYLQNPPASVMFEVRTAADPMAAVGAIREAVRQIDRNLPMMDISTQLEQVERRFLQEKVFAQAYALFGGVALLLASIGLFGLMSYAVVRRTNEIGIRMALGARSADVLRLVMRESMTLVAAGVAIGIAVALAAGRLVATQLFGLAPTDVPTMIGAMAVMIAVSAIAAYLPARRAAHVDPMIALHYE